MNPEKLTDSREAVAIIEQFKVHSTESNCYLMPNDISRLSEGNLLSVCIDGRNAFLFEDKGNCLRVHYMLNDLDRGFSIKADKPLMLEILFRGGEGEPTEATAYWERAGFRRNVVRRNLSAKINDLMIPHSSNLGSVRIQLASTDSEARFAREIFNSSFDPYSGDYLTHADANNLIENKQLLIATVANKYVGALNFFLVGRCASLGHVAVTPEARGQGVGLSLVSEYVCRNYTDEKSRYALWVQEHNIPAMKMYEQLGFKYAGKSSLSMIKD